ncbi:ATP phosphoribosyltransferase regulatory subunit [Marininema mesophilum]|uniref:ATP phosphoribosyltransferase regulatory subunit n=1 Tax=Marininema mesophilum TaxID=1048340 RepID=A0A1H2TNY7_9BACL|nr:ATP phosphoribosyltransferase regulatory subunit [Marininema mesophilum]SDW45601.1 ATP phosphoribosyltransferase regulatory subunit [Marininema mesophilum]
MSNIRTFEKPTGVRDLPPDITAKKRWVEARVEACFRRWGYREVVTPTLEYFETVGGASAIAEDKLFKLLDKQGQTLVLRPDHTAPIARVVASLLRDEPVPMRLHYHGNVFRAQDREAGRFAEFHQSGVELVGGASPEADAEIIALAVESLRELGITPIQVAVGHIDLLDALLLEQTGSSDSVAKLKESLGARNIVSYRENVKELNIPSTNREKLLQLLRFRGGYQVLSELEATTSCERALERINHLRAIWTALEDWGVAEYVIFDLSLVGSLDYYTGIYFEGYGAEGYYLLSGGRYDHLLERFDRDNPARGFALKTDRLIMASPGGLMEEERIALVYPEELRRAAFQRAHELRNQGKVVGLYKEEEMDSSAQDYDRVLHVGEGFDG